MKLTVCDRDKMCRILQFCLFYFGKPGKSEVNKASGDTQPAPDNRISVSTRQSVNRQSNSSGKKGNSGNFSHGKANEAGRKRASGSTFRGNRRKKRKNNSSVYAALDLGTNNCRLLVARPTRRGFMVIDAFSRIIRLGEGLTQTGYLAENAMNRTIEALKVCSGKMMSRGVQRSHLIATEACRIASNGSEFIDRVKNETGLKLDVISRETEARLAVSGCASLIDRQCDWALIFDIGGGSSELIWLDLSETVPLGRARRTLYDRVETQNAIHAWTSLPIGVVKLAEKFGGNHVSGAIFEDMVQYVMHLLSDFEAKHNISQQIKDRNVHFLGTSGTVTTLAGIHLGLRSYDRNKVDGTWMDTPTIRSVTDRLIAMSYNERVAQPCIGAERADLVLAGCAILEALIRTWPSERLRIADRGLREGILAVLMAEDKVHQR